MDTIFIDSHYLVALINRRDHWHHTAIEIAGRLNTSKFIVTDSVFVEPLNYFAEFPADTKRHAAQTIQDFSTEPSIEVIEQTSNLIESDIHFYRSRLDKGYSLTDCISMLVCREFGITRVLTNDRHFRQEGFEVLL